jgi:16S rRNA G966 N2-methylase RsmD
MTLTIYGGIIFSEAEQKSFYTFQLMRIISGKYKEDASLPKRLTRLTTTDMSKLFNVINNHFSFEGLKILDLFAGTGNISYECLRVAPPITSVDGDFGCVKFIKQVAAEYDFNIAATKVMF